VFIILTHSQISWFWSYLLSSWC